jgi:hypothetical protein
VSGDDRCREAGPRPFSDLLRPRVYRKWLVLCLVGFGFVMSPKKIRSDPHSHFESQFFLHIFFRAGLSHGPCSSFFFRRHVHAIIPQQFIGGMTFKAGEKQRRYDRHAFSRHGANQPCSCTMVGSATLLRVGRRKRWFDDRLFRDHSTRRGTPNPMI